MTTDSTAVVPRDIGARGIRSGPDIRTVDRLLSEHPDLRCLTTPPVVLACAVVESA